MQIVIIVVVTWLTWLLSTVFLQQVVFCWFCFYSSQSVCFDLFSILLLKVNSFCRRHLTHTVNHFRSGFHFFFVSNGSKSFLSFWNWNYNCRLLANSQTKNKKTKKCKTKKMICIFCFVAPHWAAKLSKQQLKKSPQMQINGQQTVFSVCVLSIQWICICFLALAVNRV